MYVSLIHEDVGVVYGWFGQGEEYKEFKMPKIPLLLALLMDSQKKVHEKQMLADGWKEAAWYPGCHESLKDGNRATLFMLEQKVSPIKELPKERRWDHDTGHYKMVSPGPFNEYAPFSCSCVAYKTRVEMTLVSDLHRTLGVHRMTEPTKTKRFGHWRRFATTSLASYWYWGLSPKETNVYKYERD